MDSEEHVVLSPQQANALLRYLPTFQEQGFAPGTWQTREGDVPWFAYKAEVSSFVQTLYDQGLLLSFNWPTWSAEAEEYLHSPQRVQAADLYSLRKLLTVLVRGDRFVEGLLARAFEQGLIVALLERVRELLAGTDA